MKAKHAAASIKNSSLWHKVFCALLAASLLLLMVPSGLRAHAENTTDADNAAIEETQNDDNAEEVTNEDSNEAMVEAEAANTDSVDINEKTIWNFPDCGFSDEQEFRLENLQEATTPDTSITQTQNIDIHGINTASGVDSLMTYYSSENGIDVMDDSASDKYYFKIPAIDGYKISSVSYVARVDMTNVKYSVKIGDTLLGTALNTKTISSTDASLKTYTPTTDLISDLYVYWNQTSAMAGSVIFQGIGVTYEEYTPEPVMVTMTNGGGVFPSYLHLSENPDYDWTFDPSTGNYTAEVPYGTLTSVIDRLWRYDYPMKENTLFEGWENDAVGDKITEDTTFTPIWWSDEIVTYKVKFITEEQNDGNTLYSADEYLISKGSTYSWSIMSDGTAYLEFNEGSSALPGPYRAARAVPTDDYIASFDLPESGVLDSDLTVYADFDYNGPAGIKGIVYDFAGNPLGDVNVDVYNTSGALIKQAVTSSDESHLGEYSISLEVGFEGYVSYHKEHYISHSQDITIISSSEASVISPYLDRQPELIFHSTSEGHDKFVMDVYSDGEIVETYEDVAADEFLYEGVEIYLDENGVLTVDMELNDNEITDGYTAKAIPKDSYTLSSWSVNGVDYEIGKESDVITLENNVVYDIQPNYTSPAPLPIESLTAQTGDNNAIPFVIISLVVIAGACGAFAARKYFNKK